MDVLKTFIRLRKEEEEQREKASKAEGALDEIMSSIKKEFNCETLKESQTKLKILQKRKKKKEAEFEKAVEKYEEKWENNEDREDEED